MPFMRCIRYTQPCNASLIQGVKLLLASLQTSQASIFMWHHLLFCCYKASESTVVSSESWSNAKLGEAGGLVQARSEVEVKRNKLAKLRGVAGIREDKIAEAERELNEAAHKVEGARQTYELIVHRMSEDLSRFQVG